MGGKTGKHHISVQRTQEGERKRERLLAYMQEYIQREGWAPRREEMAEAIGLTPRMIDKHIAVLIEEGRVETDFGRGIRITPGVRPTTLNAPAREDSQSA